MGRAKLIALHETAASRAHHEQMMHSFRGLCPAQSRRFYSSVASKGSLGSSAGSSKSGSFRLSGVKGDGKSLRLYDNVKVLPMTMKEDSLEVQWAVDMDGRLLQTPRNRILLLNSEGLALGIAGEFARQDKFMRPTSMPLTTLASSAIDQFGDTEERHKILCAAKRYLRTDSTCYRADSPKGLTERQAAVLDPLMDWLATDLGAPLNYSSALSISQPESSIERLHERISSYDKWRLSALDSVASIARSYVIGLAFVDGKLNVDSAFDASRVDEEFQIQAHGLVEGSHDIDQAFVRLKLQSAQTYLSLLEL